MCARHCAGRVEADTLLLIPLSGTDLHASLPLEAKLSHPLTDAYEAALRKASRLESSAQSSTLNRGFTEAAVDL